ncbi:hypothetical protein, partial [Sulfobacillus harzensis]|uniref:hypothetical protein n=1 Tax=Sulfobacillus harzensis TaxID=2729629 RepID=UPI001A9C181D
APVGVSYFRVHTLGVADFGIFRQYYRQNSAIIPLLPTMTQPCAFTQDSAIVDNNGRILRFWP